MKRVALCGLPLLATVLLGACEGPTIPPRIISEIYDFRLATTPRSVLRWPSGTTIRVHPVTALPGRAGLFEDALARGAAVWNSTARYGEYRLVVTSDLADADVVVRWSDEVAPVDMSGCQPQVSRAVTTFCLAEDDPTRLHVYPLRTPATGTGSIRIIVSLLGAEASASARLDRLVAHELGHVLGIATHSLNPDDLMYGGELTRSTLSRRDAATIQTLYHTVPEVTP